MSADLLAAFGDDEQKEWSQKADPFSPQRTDGARPESEDEEDFGDFAGANPWSTGHEQNINHGVRQSEEMQTAAPQEHQRDHDDVLFDAYRTPSPEANSDSDEFGDFEGVAKDWEQQKSSSTGKPLPPPATTVQPNELDILTSDAGLSCNTATKVRPPAASILPSRPLVRNIPIRTNVKGPKEQNSPPTALSDAWEDFSATTPSATNAMSDTSEASDQKKAHLTQDLLSCMTAPCPSSPPLPPTNIPPPSLLLSLFPPLFSQLSTPLAHSLAPKIPLQDRDSVFPAQLTFLTNYRTVLVVLAHIIAGRKHRWRRDKFLAQSMSIGPSSSGRSGGMKLAGVDKGEQQREEVEVREVVRSYRGQVGTLKSLFAQTNAALVGKSAKSANKVGSAQAFGGLEEMMDGVEQPSGPVEESNLGRTGSAATLPPVPDIRESMPLRTATRAEGAIFSTQGCALCGLKREERVQTVDAEVLDSFGEWWIEGTNMHTACWRFWEGFKKRLNQR